MKYLFLLLGLTGCVSASRSELTVQVEQREEQKPTVVVAYKITSP